MKFTNNRLMSRFFGFSKKEALDLEIKQENYSLKKRITSICSEIKASAAVKKLPILVEYDESIPSLIRGDAEKISYILEVLLSKAVENTTFGYIKLLVDGQVCDDKVELSFKIKYTGKSIYEKDHLINKIKGDLNDIYLILDAMGSELILKADDECSSGCEFTLMQDIAIGDKIVSKDRKLEVLVIDDDAINVNIFKSLLKNHSLNIYAGYSGVECLEMLEKIKYDIVFLDHMMSDLDGIETLRIHKKNEKSLNKDTPIIVLTANVESGAKEEYLKEGFSGYLPKPIVLDSLIRIIHENCC